MDVGKYEIYFKFWPGYLTSEPSERVRYSISYFQARIHVLLCLLLYKKYSSLPHKNIAVNCNVYHGNQAHVKLPKIVHMCYYRACIKITKTFGLFLDKIKLRCDLFERLRPMQRLRGV